MRALAPMTDLLFREHAEHVRLQLRIAPARFDVRDEPTWSLHAEHPDIDVACLDQLSLEVLGTVEERRDEPPRVSCVVPIATIRKGLVAHADVGVEGRVQGEPIQGPRVPGDPGH